MKLNRYILILAIILDFLVLLYVANNLDISYKEAKNYFINFNPITILTHISTYIFGQNNIAFRLPFIIFHLFSVILIFLISRFYFKEEKYQVLVAIIFMLLPGIVSSAILANTSSIVIFATLLYIYLYQKTKKHNVFLLIFYFFIDNSFWIFYLSLAIFSFYEKKRKYFMLNIILMLLSIIIFGFDNKIEGKSYLFDILAFYASIFSPFIMLYFLYSIYRVGIKGNKDIIWYISTTALIVSLIFSFFGQIFIEDFAPFVVIFLPVMLKSFIISFKIRLPMFRLKYYIYIFLSITFLVINYLLLIENKLLYIFIKPQKHFIYKYDFAKKVSIYLKQKQIYNVTCDNKEFCLRLKFYGINNNGKVFLALTKIKDYDDIIDIKYYDKSILKIYLKGSNETNNLR